MSNQGGPSSPTLRTVTSTAPVEIPVQATVKLPESLWRRAKIEAINRRMTVSELVQQMLEERLAGPASIETAGRRKKGGAE